MTMFITYLSTFDSLERTLDAYYERQRFADVFVSVKRAPQRLEARLAAIRGVETVDDTRRRQRDTRRPWVDRACNRPPGLAAGEPAAPANDVVLRSGRWIDRIACRRGAGERGVLSTPTGFNPAIASRL